VAVQGAVAVQDGLQAAPEEQDEEEQDEAQQADSPAADQASPLDAARDVPLDGAAREPCIRDGAVAGFQAAERAGAQGGWWARAALRVDSGGVPGDSQEPGVLQDDCWAVEPDGPLAGSAAARVGLRGGLKARRGELPALFLVLPRALVLSPDAVPGGTPQRASALDAPGSAPGEASVPERGVR